MFLLRNFLLKIAGIKLGRGVSFCGRSWIYGRGNLSIGDDTWISPGALIFTNTEVDITIGKSCDIGPGVEFITGSHHLGSSARRAGTGFAKAITVEDGVWIGHARHGAFTGAGGLGSRNAPQHPSCLWRDRREPSKSLFSGRLGGSGWDFLLLRAGLLASRSSDSPLPSPGLRSGWLTTEVPSLVTAAQPPGISTRFPILPRDKPGALTGQPVHHMLWKG